MGGRRARRRYVGRRRAKPLTRTLHFPAPHVTLESLAVRTLAELQQELGPRT